MNSFCGAISAKFPTTVPTLNIAVVRLENGSGVQTHGFAYVDLRNDLGPLSVDLKNDLGPLSVDLMNDLGPLSVDLMNDLGR